jgi:hypothetical protein
MKIKKLDRIGRFKLLAVVFIAPVLLSWGTFGHEHINHAAVLALPGPLQTFFYNHIDFITQESTVPDVRKYTHSDKAEHPRHFIDLENFGPLDSLPLTMAAAKGKYEEKFLQQNGILPWYLQDLMEKLTKAIKEKRKTEIIFLAADLGHYLGDAFMPLHTSANYDGQQTNQKGIHAFWESQLPELFGDGYNFNIGEATFIPNIQQEIWNILASSHAQIEPLLSAEREVHASFPADQIYMKDASGNYVKNKYNQQIHSLEYAKAYHEKLNGMVEQQMRKAVAATANFWFTAWVNAGKPDLSDLDAPELTKRNAENLQKELTLLKEGKLFGISSEKEY